ncbi:MAG: YbhB/YbcL family Raf kinase inhibitor-like protein [Halodesulfovibrio sp.]
MRIFSPAFEDGGFIPAEHTCDGENTSPALQWTDVPTGAKFLTLICDDPDAPMGVWDHWLLFNLPAAHEGLDAGISREFDPFPGVAHGLNSWKRACYDGPCPPSGTHRYYFKLYALDSRINLKPGATKGEILRAMDGHILAECRIMGRYSRK